MTATKRPKARLMSEHFYIRDDEAECQSCDWHWASTDSAFPDRRNEGTRVAKQHAQAEGHEVVVKRVEFHRHTGIID